jgi:signal transduction histidine kinase
MRTRRGRLYRKYVLLFVALVGGMLVASGVLQLFFSYQESQAATLRIERVEAARAALRISQFVDGIRVQMQAILPPAGLGDVPLDQRRAEYRALLRRAPEIADMSFIDASGLEQLRVSRLSLDLEGHGTDRTREPAFLETRAGGTFFGPVEFRRGSEPHFRLALPDGAGVSVADVNLKFILEAVTSIKVGAAGYAYVVDRTGQLIAHPDISLVLGKTDLSSRPQFRASLSGLTPLEEHAMIASDLAGRPVLTAFDVIGTTGWTVFVEQPLDEAFAPVYASLLRAAGFVVLGLIISAAASLILARRMIVPIEALRAGAARMGAGALEQRIEVRTGDELEELADEFNRMTERLRESYANLEQKVVDRTHELSAANQQLREATLAKSRFLANMSHELRTPLNAIIGFADLLIDRIPGELTRTQEEHVRDIRDSGKHQLSLINDILDLSKVEAGRMELERSEFSVGAVSRSAATLIREQAVRRSIRLDVVMDPDVTVLGDARRVKQVILNLLANAVKFTPDGGRIGLTARRVEDAVEIVVRDTGRGISPEEQTRIFEEFAQAGAGGFTQEGTGLGLTLAQRIVALHGGRISVDSEVGRGSTFTFTLPLRPAPSGAALDAVAADSGARQAP